MLRGERTSKRHWVMRRKNCQISNSKMCRLSSLGSGEAGKMICWQAGTAFITLHLFFLWNLSFQFSKEATVVLQLLQNLFDKYDATLSFCVLLWTNLPKIYFPRIASIYKYRKRNMEINIKKRPEKCPTTTASNALVMEVLSSLVAWNINVFKIINNHQW